MDAFEQGSSGGGGGGTCDQNPPLDASTLQQSFRIIFGLVTPKAVKVVVEHADGGEESISTVTVNGFTTRFYAGGMTDRAPITKLVAYDSSGHSVAEDTNVATLNAGH